jgi:TonB family C-terminal domain
MNRQAHGFFISLIIHTVVIVLAVVIGTTSASMNTKPVVIDLSILESIINSTGTPKDDPDPKLAPKAAEPETPKTIEKPKRVQKIRQLEKKVDTEPSEPKIVTPVEKEGPVPIASTEVQKTQPLTETFPGIGDQSARGTGVGEGGGVGSSGNGTGGISADALRKKYLSEHFAYIKNIIQENISYPVRAQRMGWQGKVIIDFIILENGSASHISIAQSSGFEILDDNVIKTVEAVAPFPKPPVKAELRVPIVYRLE